MIVVGIDPGLSGAIAILENNKVLNIFDMPVMAEGKKNKRQLNSAQLVSIIKDSTKPDAEIAVVVEQVNAMPGQGVTSMFNFGQTFGAIKGVCAALNLSIFFVRPGLQSMILHYGTNWHLLMRCLANWKIGFFIGITAVISTIAWFYAFAIFHLGPVRAVGQIELIISILFSWLFLKEKITLLEVIGISILGVSIVIVLLYA